MAINFADEHPTMQDGHGHLMSKTLSSVKPSSSTGSLVSDDSSSSRFSLRPCEATPRMDDSFAEHQQKPCEETMSTDSIFAEYQERPCNETRSTDDDVFFELHERPCRAMRSEGEILAEHHKMHDVGICTPCALSSSGKGCLMGWNCHFCHLPHDKPPRVSQRRKRERSSRKEQLDELCEAVADEVLFAERLAHVLLHRDAFTVSCVKSRLRSLVRSKRIPESTLALAVRALKRSDQDDAVRDHRSLISL
eukprot:TRINITY_DN25951_c0_g9_i1.p1 TRINITY_DN25951_c0_g9~~TRINITY_DN25951_c0_g9_i1.p1  ORF type:complete len:250 (-),score=46.60 TRINITY_DN25951_c0_g9_i1:229-978(-)